MLTIADECSEKFATRMLYCCLFLTIHSAAETTSLVRAMPRSSITSRSIRFALGATPA
jgi:hypothetical protein